MRHNLLGIVFTFLLQLYFFQLAQGAVPKTDALCKEPFWNAPAESQDGIFTGDLVLDCTIPGNPNSEISLASLRKKIIAKIESNSTVYESPKAIDENATLPLNWDVSHRFNEDGNTITIRESIQISTRPENELWYETHSKEVSATGMASYLRSVEFTMILRPIKNQLNVRFRNKVHVKRPWFALDLIFAPIARNICFKKMELVKIEFTRWLADSIQEPLSK